MDSFFSSRFNMLKSTLVLHKHKMIHPHVPTSDLVSISLDGFLQCFYSHALYVVLFLSGHCGFDHGAVFFTFGVSAQVPFLLAKRQAHVGLHVGDEMMVPASVLTTERRNNSPSDDHSVFIYPCNVIFTGVLRHK